MAEKRKKYALATVISITLILLAGLASIFSYQQVYAGKIYRNIYFADVDLSGKTRHQAEQILSEKFQQILDKEIILQASDKEVKAFVKDTGLSFDIQQIVDESYNYGRNSSFIDSLIDSSRTLFSRHSVTATPYINSAKYDNFLKIAVEQLNLKPIDASLKIESGQITVADGIDGQTVKTEHLDEKIIQAVGENNSVISIDSDITQPAVKNADFEAAKNEAEAYLSKNINLSYEDKAYKPSRVEIGAWIEFKNNNGQFYATLNESSVKAYLIKISKNFEIARVDRKINASTNEVIEEGHEGLYLDKDKTYNELKSKLSSGQLITIGLTTYKEAPKELRVFPLEGFIPGRFEGRYVDVDLTAQKLCRVEGPTLIDCFTISSGKPSMPTPTGTFHITAKNPKQWSSKYGLWMPYWQQFNGPYGLHELPEWPNGYKEGQNHLGIPVSHGCVRLGVGDAQTLFDWTSIGTPVYIHK